MRVNFGGSDAFVSQHFLNRPQIGTTFNEVRGKRVPESVGTDTFSYSGGFHQLFDNGKDHYSGKSRTPSVQK